MRGSHLVPLLFAALGACGPSVTALPDGQPAPDADPSPDAFHPDGPVADYSRVYGHTGQQLYRLDTTTLEPVLVGAFTNTGSQSITDIAIDKNDNMRGITLTRIFTIDGDTAASQELTQIAAGTPNLTSLSFVPVDLSDPNSAEILVAAADDGTVYEIDPGTGATTVLGSYGSTAGGLIRSSGDIVAVRGLGIYATVTIGDNLADPDYLAVIDPTDWHATPIGIGTGYDKIFGLGFWRDTLYGFVDLGTGNGGAIVAIDPNTGAATVVNQGDLRWYGAGVATDAPVIN